ncbi:TVP38/TMEM64 family protein [Bacillus salitolerans]|uniref:TVP38/TMEM64 family membrane protein n=1 Tax=Bacillus salitolerans TaxID=1437434 RepID=A0ABW4LR81_9BACI
MKDTLVQLLLNYPHIAWVISIMINIVVSFAAFIPSFFVTSANILVFGFWQGTLLSFIGETLGAILSFLLYRRGLVTFNFEGRESKYLKKLVAVSGFHAFWLLLSLRLLPFIPSGLVNIYAALGKISLPIFISSTLIGKIPALFIEASASYQIISLGKQGNMFLLSIGIIILIGLLFTKYRNISK